MPATVRAEGLRARRLSQLGEDVVARLRNNAARLDVVILDLMVLIQVLPNRFQLVNSPAAPASIQPGAFVPSRMPAAAQAPAGYLAPPHHPTV